jgi:outer membrane lipoprotein carrier protein
MRLSKLSVLAPLSLVMLSTAVTSLAQTPPPKPSTTASAAPTATASASAAPTGTSTSATDVSAKIQKVYDGITNYEADFTQQYSMKAFGQKKDSKGHVTFVKPGKMRWDYTDPKDNVVVSDGVTLWSYVASDKQARKMLVKDSQMPTALAFLTGKGELAKDFDLKLLDAAKYKFEKGYVLEARPKAATNLYSFVLFYVDGATYQVRRVLIVDAQNNRNRFDFDKPKVNEKVDDSRFKWSPPTGVTITAN